MLLSFTAFGEIKDNLKLLTSDDMEVLTKRVMLLEKDYGIKFHILISNKEENLENSLNNESKSVIINMVKPDNTPKIKLKLKFSEDIDVVGYKENIEEMLTKLETLAVGRNYLDTLYELTGNIAVDIVNLSEFEKNQAIGNNIYKKLAGIFFLLAVISGSLTLFLYWVRYVAKKVRKCKKCGIELTLLEDYEEDGKKVKIYGCRLCGYKRKVTSVRR
jgi:hypothetical protein